MKILGAAILALLLGATVAGVATMAHYSGDAEFSALPSLDPTARPMSKGPRVEIVNGEHFNFGSMEKDTEMSHVFTIRNAGDSVLTLKKGDTTCKCTLSNLDQDALAPGESAEVLLTWTPKSYDEHFTQTAEIHTNDPARSLVELEIEGFVREGVRAAPSELALGDLASNAGGKGELKVFAYVDKPVEITSLTMADPDTADYFEFKQSPLDPEELESEGGATSGVRVEVLVKPGLPLGPISQTIRIATNLGDEHSFETPVTGTVIGDISWLVTEHPFRREQSLLQWGAVDGAKGAETNLFLLLKGELRDKVELSVGDIVPAAALEVELGEPRSAGGGKSVLVPVTVRVKPGSRAANYLGATRERQAKVVINTTHPDIPQAPLYIQLSIEN